MRKFIGLPLLVLFLGILSGCEKHQAKKLAGTYDCTVESSSWMMGSATVDTTYKELLVVKASGKNIVIFNGEIPIAEMSKDKSWSAESAHTSFYVRFKDDKIYLKSTSGGLGGSGTRIYNGKKTD